jgi:hypothetical protein
MASTMVPVRGSSGSDAATARVRTLLTASSRAAKIAPGDPRTVSAHRVVRPCDGTARRREGTADAPGVDGDGPDREGHGYSRVGRFDRVLAVRRSLRSGCHSLRTLHVVTWQRRGTKTSQKLFHAKSSIPSNKHGYALRDSYVTTPTRT